MLISDCLAILARPGRPVVVGSDRSAAIRTCVCTNRSSAHQLTIEPTGAIVATSSTIRYAVSKSGAA